MEWEVTEGDLQGKEEEDRHEDRQDMDNSQGKIWIRDMEETTELPNTKISTVMMNILEL
jgi:hypothetical protein